VTFAGFVSEADKVGWLQHAALLVQCSVREGWGLTVSEAGACGTPVVATDVPGLTDSVQDGVTGLLVRRARPGPLAAAITKLLADVETRQRMSRRALAWSANFDWNETASAVLRAIRRAVRPAAVPVAVPRVAVKHLVGSAVLASDPGGSP
jgi:glycosyltransferase involved in cell wall biosynthesis